MSAPEPLPFDQPHFDEPWQAEVFAMVVALKDKGLFSWSEWATALGREIAAGPQESGNQAYFSSWLKALEGLLIEKQITTADDLASIGAAWREAAEATPHGQPIVLGPH